MALIDRFCRPMHTLAGFVRKIWFLFPNDELFLRIIYRLEMGHWLDLKNPQTFTEKIQWLKLYDRKPEYTRMVDKITAKEYVSEIIGKEYIIPTLGVWDHFEDIDFSMLPDAFVLKTNHGSGGSDVVICRDKTNFDYLEAKRILERSLKGNCYHKYREWPYKDVKPQIFAEELLAEVKDDNIQTKSVKNSEIFDYKFFCFDGKVKFYKIDFGRFINHHANYYSVNGEFLDFCEKDFPSSNSTIIEIPPNIDKMINLSEKLSEGFRFLRVDLYNIAGRIYFGELTFYPASGFELFEPAESDKDIGKFLKLRI